jgi:hypothetical protein
MGETWILTQVELATAWERRRVEHQLIPLHNGLEKSDPVLPQIDPWTVSLEVPRDGRAATVEKPLPELARNARCPCVTDRMDREYPCTICRGAREVRATPVAVAETGTVRWLRAIEPRMPRGLPAPIVIHVSGMPMPGKVVVRREAPGIDDVQAISAAGYRTAGPLFSDVVRNELARVLDDPGLEPGARRVQQVLEVREIPIRREGRAWTIGDPPVPWTGDDDYDPPLSISRVAALAAIVTTMVVLTFSCIYTIVLVR